MVISDGAVITAGAESCVCKGGEYENCSGAPAAADELRRMTVLPAEGEIPNLRSVL